MIGGGQGYLLGMGCSECIMMQGNIRENEISHTLWGSLLLLTGACRSNKSISPGSTESKTSPDRSNGDSIEYGRMVDYEER